MFFASRKLIITTLLCLTMFALSGVSIYAESNSSNLGEVNEKSTDDDALDYFNYSYDYLIELAAHNETSTFSGSLYTSYDVELSRGTALKDLGTLQLSTGFDRNRLTTFSKTKAISGVGKAGAQVGLQVFHIVTSTTDNKSKKYLVSTQDELVKIGNSGLYNETIYFDYIGVNYVLLTVEDPITFASTKRLYKVTLKAIATRNKLENMTIDFFKEEVKSPSIEEFVPGIFNFGF